MRKDVSSLFCDSPDMLISACCKCHALLITTFCSYSHLQHTGLWQDPNPFWLLLFMAGVSLFRKRSLQGECSEEFTFALGDFLEGCLFLLIMAWELLYQILEPRS